jgi:apolipoprotein N-acyltransferase
LHSRHFAAIAPGVEKHPRLIALLAGIVAATGFAPIGAWPLTLAALAVFALLVVRAATVRRAALIGWLFGVGHFSLGNNWIAGAFYHQDAMPQWLGYFAVVLLALYLAVYPAIAAALAKWLAPRGGLPFALVFAGSWIVTEYGRATIFTGFAWDPLGAIFVPTWIAAWSRVIGTYGLSGLAILGAGLAIATVGHRRAMLLLSGGALAVAAGGWAILRPDPGLTNRTVRIVQPNMNLDETRDPLIAREGLQKLARLSGLPGPAPRIILWSEAAINDAYEIAYDAALRDELASLLGPKDLLLTGATRIEYQRRPAPGGIGTEERATGATNSVFLIDPAGSIRARYDKAHLVPYGEYLPMRPLLTPLGLARLVPGDLDFHPGPGPATLALPGGGKAGVQICYEIVFSGEVIDRNNRPDFLFNASTDAWFGSWGPPQHLAQAQLRAIEEGLPIVRSTPTGISALIDARGVALKTVALGTEGFIDAKLPAALAPTPFSRFGNVLPLAFAFLLGLAGVALGRRRR